MNPVTSAHILAVDTTTEFGSIAVLEGERLIAEVLLQSRTGFGQILFDQIRGLLDRAGVRLADIGCFAAASGPGAFTGVRVGLAAIKGLATALNRPAVGVSNLQAIASLGTFPIRAAFTDARRNEIYGAVYGASLAPILPEIVVPFRPWIDSLPNEEMEFLTTDFGPFRQALAGTRFEQMRMTQAPRALAGAVGRIASMQLDRGLAQDTAAIDANYVRRSDAEMRWRDEG